MEICEIADHPWYLGCQFHPEFKSKPLEPHPLFRAFIGAALRVSRASSGKRRWRNLLPDTDDLSTSAVSDPVRQISDRGKPLVLIAGPCVIESEEHVHFLAREIRKRSPGTFVFKASFDKANRSSVEVLSRPRA